MPTYKIGGIDVDFPFEAYECQIIYMEKVIRALQNKCNALLESPTGTGKTLCLLCAALAWRKSLGDFSRGNSDLEASQSGGKKLPTIVYTSRTHSQLRQVVQELKRSTYRPKMVVLGSREQLCIHDEVSLLRGKVQTNACQFLCRKRSHLHCEHFARATDYMKQNPHLGEEPIDIEDLVNIGKRSGPCPYYISRELHKDVDVLFAPYNYLIDRGNRKSLKLDWKDCILIFDEAHNLEGLCAEAASFDLPGALLSACISEANNCINIATGRRDKSNDTSVNPDNFAILKALLLKFEQRIAELPLASKELGFTKPGPYIYELLADLNITHKTAPKLINMIEEAVVLLEEDKKHKANDTASRIEIIGDILKLIFRDGGSNHAEFYRVHVREAESNATNVVKGKKSRTLSWWCFNPGIAMREFSSMDVGSIILTSGTLSPMDSFAQELKLDFPIQLENPHVISSNQLWAGVVPVGPSGCSFNSSYRNRDSLEYKQELGNAIVNFARIVPDGLLVFFPSYYLLDQCIRCWKNESHGNSMPIWKRICKHKKPVIEPKQSSMFLQSIQDYMAKLQDTSSSGAVFFAVCRGKVSEGLDFADHAGRAVVITGMPFAMTHDPKVRLKREYLDEQVRSVRADSKALKPATLTGEDWYSQQASRAVNQAIGRVIRHSHDYGAIIFCDERFLHPNRLSQISRWIQPNIKCYPKFGDVVLTLTRFFRDEGTRCSANLRLKQQANIGNAKEGSSAQSVNKCHSIKNASEDFGCSAKLLSSRTETSRADRLDWLADLPPANLAFLSPSDEKQTMQLKQSSIFLGRDAKIVTSSRKDVHNQSLEIINIDDSFLDGKPAKELLGPCSLKRRKLTSVGSDKTKDMVHKVINLESDGMQDIGESEKHASGSESSQSNYCFTAIELVKKRKNLENLDEGGLDTGQEISSRLGERGKTMQQKQEELESHESEGAQTSSVASGEREASASEYLIQVREKLNAAEYNKFLDYMRALKTKALKIADVIESIARLFSGPERLPLLRRFKDFVPTKHRSLYEQRVEKSKPST